MALKKAERKRVKLKIAMSGVSGCVDCDTEFFNGSQWKKISEYEKGDKVLEFNTETGEAVLCYPLQYHKYEADTLWEIVSKYGVNQCLSDEHNFLYLTSKNHYNKRPVAEVRELHERNDNGFSGRIPTTFYYNSNGIDLSDAQIKVMLAVICDGSFIKGNDTNKCRFHIKKNRKKEELRKIFAEANIEWRERESAVEGYTDFYICAPRREKEFLPYWYKCNNHQLLIVCDNVLKWDGNYSKPTPSGAIRKRFSTNNKNNADFVQFAFTACGYRARIAVKDRSGQEYFTCNKYYTRKSVEYNISITDRVNVGIAGNIHPDFHEYKTKDGYKYCFTTPTSNLVLRRGGCIFITGNSGKSNSALFIAYGLLKKLHLDWTDEQIWDAIAVVDTENESASQYADCTKAGYYIGTFNTAPIAPPFTSEKYVQAINECKESKIEVCIVDSLTHLWDGEGGTKDKQANIAKRTGNSFTSWREPKKEFRTVIDKILQTDMHFICTMRSKADYSQEKDANNKTIIRKVGLAPIIAEGTDYEFTTVFDLDTDHIAGVSKDRTGLFDGTYHKITPETGMKFADYILSSPVVSQTQTSTESAIPTTEPNPKTGRPTNMDPDFLRNEITTTFGGYLENVTDADEKTALRDRLYSLVAENNNGKKNWLKVNDVTTLNNILTALKDFEN